MKAAVEIKKKVDLQWADRKKRYTNPKQTKGSEQGGTMKVTSYCCFFYIKFLPLIATSLFGWLKLARGKRGISKVVVGWDVD